MFLPALRLDNSYLTFSDFGRSAENNGVRTDAFVTRCFRFFQNIGFKFARLPATNRRCYCVFYFCSCSDKRVRTAPGWPGTGVGPDGEDRRERHQSIERRQRRRPGRAAGNGTTETGAGVQQLQEVTVENTTSILVLALP